MKSVILLISLQILAPAFGHPGSGIFVDRQGAITTVLRAASPWSPTGVAVSGDSIYVLEFLHTASGNRRDWIPRVRKIHPSPPPLRGGAISPGGSAVVLAIVERTGSAVLRDGQSQARADSFLGSRAGYEREVAGVVLCWCPPGRFQMGSPPGEPERRPGETQVEVTLSRASGWASTR